MNEALNNILLRNSPRELSEPFPNEEEMEKVYQAALRAPDHAWQRPSRFIEVTGDGLKKLSAVFEDFAKEETQLMGEYGNDPIAKLKARELDIRAQDDFTKAQQSQEKINLDRMKAFMNQQNKDEKLEQNEELAELRAATSLAKQEMANRSKIHDFGRNFKKK